MDLFEVVNGTAIPSTHALIIEPFKTIWIRDVDIQHHAQAIKEFTFIELLCSMKKSNPYSGYAEDIRAKKVANNIWPEIVDYMPDPVMISAINTYQALQEEASPTLGLVLSAQQAIHKLKNFLNMVDMAERTKSGGPVFKPVDITNAIKSMPEAINSLEKLENKVQQELFDSTKTRSDREIGFFEDPQRRLQ
jgi:hypothetical protein